MRQLSHQIQRPKNIGYLDDDSPIGRINWAVIILICGYLALRQSVPPMYLIGLRCVFNLRCSHPKSYLFAQLLDDFEAVRFVVHRHFNDNNNNTELLS